MSRLLFLLVVLGAAWLPATAVPAATGLYGSVSVSPNRPGPQQTGQAGSEPLSRMTVRAVQADGREVARTTTDDQGKFMMPVSPGTYDVTVDTSGAVFPRCQPVHAFVHDGVMARVEILCDSGMR